MVLYTVNGYHSEAHTCQHVDAHGSRHEQSTDLTPLEKGIFNYLNGKRSENDKRVASISQSVQRVK